MRIEVGVGVGLVGYEGNGGGDGVEQEVYCLVRNWFC